MNYILLPSNSGVIFADTKINILPVITKCVSLQSHRPEELSAMITKNSHTALRVFGGAVVTALLVSGCSCGSQSDAKDGSEVQTVESKSGDTTGNPLPEIQYHEWNADSYTDDEVYDEGYDEGYRQGLQDGEAGARYGDGFYDDNDFGTRYELFCEGYEEGYETGYAEGRADYDEEQWLEAERQRMGGYVPIEF